MKRTSWILIVCIGLLLFISGCGGGGGGSSSAAPAPEVNDPTQLNAIVGEPLNLDAAIISEEAAPISSEWSLVTRPTDSSGILIDNANLATTKFTADKVGDYVVVLTTSTSEYTVNITAYPPLGTILLPDLAGDPVVMAIQRTEDNGFIFSGSIANLDTNSIDAFAAKTDSLGNVQWSRIAGGTGTDHFNLAMEIDAGDGGFLFSGATDSSDLNTQGVDIFLLRLDADGDELWTGVYDGKGDEGARAMLMLPGGGVLLAGTTKIESSGITEIFLLKTDADGVEASGGDPFIGDVSDLIVNDIKDVKSTPGGGFILTGYLKGASSSDIYLAKLSADGTKEWGKAYGNNSGTNIGRYVEEATDGSFVIAGTTNAPSLVGGNQTQIYMLKTDASGNQLNDAVLGGEGTEYLYDVAKTSDGGFILTGFTNSSLFSPSSPTFEPLGAKGFDAYLAKTDSDGNLEWERAIGGDMDDISISVEPTSSDGVSEDGYLMAGFVDGTLISQSTGLSTDGTFAITRTDAEGRIE